MLEDFVYVESNIFVMRDLLLVRSFVTLITSPSCALFQAVAFAHPPPDSLIHVGSFCEARDILGSDRSEKRKGKSTVIFQRESSFTLSHVLCA